VSTHASKRRRKALAAVKGTDSLRLSGQVELKAASRARATKLKILAYSGGVMSPPGWGDVVITLSGLDISRPIPILDSHENKLDALIGTGKASVTAGTLVVEVPLGDTDAARKVVAILESGGALEASVGIEPDKTSFLNEGETRNINGRKITGSAEGITVIETAVLKETSILPLGADSQTSVALAASKKGNQVMDFHDWLKAKGFDPSDIEENERFQLYTKWESEQSRDLTADARQLATIRAASDRWERLKPDERNDPRVSAAFSACLKGHATAAELDRACLESYRSRMSAPSDGTIRGGGGYGANGRETLAAAILCHIGAESVATKAFGEPTVQGARDLRIRHAMDLVEASCRMNPSMTGLPSDRAEMIRASFGPSTYSLPSALGLAGEKLMAETYMQTPASWRAWAGKKSVTSFREHTAIRPYLAGGFEEVPPGGEITHASGAEETYAFKADTYGRMFAIDRRDLVNDDLGAFDEVFREIGRMAVRKIGDKLYSLLLSNPSSFFATGNGNYAEGASSALDIAALGSAVSLLRKQVDAAGNPIALAPAVLLVPPELEATGASILNSTTMSRESSGDMLPEGNPWQGRMSLEVEPRLSTTGFHGSISTKAWYVMAAPSTPLAVLAFLNGAEMPVVETLDAPVNQLGRSMRGYIDFGVALSDKRAGVKMKGET
jgi:hypothetical protein